MPERAAELAATTDKKADLAGGELDLAAVAGRAVFWATPPCPKWTYKGYS